MKKIIALLLLTAILTLSLASCFPAESAKLRVGYLTGPTGMGMAKLIVDNSGEDTKYEFTKYTDSTLAQADLLAGKIDIICLPTNEAAMLYSKAESNKPVVLAVNCLNSLYLLTDKNTTVTSLKDFEGQTVYTCKNGTPRKVLEYIVKSQGLNIEISYTYNNEEIAKPQDLSALVTAGKLPNAVMPEPLVTSTLLAIQKGGNPDISYSIDVNMTEEWAKISDTPVVMGCIVASSDTKNNAGLDSFLEEYKASVEFISNPDNIDSAANYVVETGIMGAVPAAKKALTNLGSAISYIDGADMKAALISFYNAIGVTLPDEEFYYEK